MEVPRWKAVFPTLLHLFRREKVGDPSVKMSRKKSECLPGITPVHGLRCLQYSNYYVRTQLKVGGNKVRRVRERGQGTTVILFGG